MWPPRTATPTPNHSPMIHTHVRYLRWLAVPLVAGSLALAGTAREVAAQAVGFKVLPTAAKVVWDDALGLRDDWFYGGRVSLLFGSAVELQPFFLRGSNLEVDSARAHGIVGSSVFPRQFDVDHYGANAQVNFGMGDVTPFVRLGGGILKFSPDSGPELRRITVMGGGGLRLQLGGLQGEVFAEEFQFRLAPSRLFSRDTSALTPGVRAPVQRNRSYGASVSIPLSSLPQEQATDGLRGTRAPLEPFVGRLRYDGSLDLPDQDMAGLRAGIDLNSLVGIRGFAWRGINDDHDGTSDIWGYGGEAQFNLNEGAGVAPYVITGAGRIDYGTDFRDRSGATRQDQTALILGGGASFGLSDRVRLNVAIRDYITTADDKVETARDPDDLLHNRLLSAGITWSIGGRTGADPGARVGHPQLDRTRSRTGAPAGGERGVAPSPHGAGIGRLVECAHARGPRHDARHDGGECGPEHRDRKVSCWGFPRAA